MAANYHQSSRQIARGCGAAIIGWHWQRYRTVSGCLGESHTLKFEAYDSTRERYARTSIRHTANRLASLASLPALAPRASIPAFPSALCHYTTVAAARSRLCVPLPVPLCAIDSD